MAQFQVYFTLEADSMADAEAAVQTWTVTPGTTMQSLMGTLVSDIGPIDVPDGGEVADGTAIDPVTPVE